MIRETCAAVLLIGAEVLVVSMLRPIAPDTSFGAIFLLGVMVVSATCDARLAVAMSAVSVIAFAVFHDEADGNVVAAVVVFLTLALLANFLAVQARLRTLEAESRRREAAQSAQAQAALGRVATMVARDTTPSQDFDTALRELAVGLDADRAQLTGFDGGRGIVLAEFERRHRSPDDGPGFAASVSVPVVVAGDTRAALIVAYTHRDSMPSDTGTLLKGFAELIAIAMINAETRAELQASRARIVSAADHARRGFERDLHDGVQQRIVVLGMELRRIEALVPAEHADLAASISGAVDGIATLHDELRELSHGIHPAILSRGGLGRAVRALARRSPIPVVLEVDIEGRLRESVEVAAYYVTAEALTNAVKHSGADTVRATLAVVDGAVAIRIRDDGVGGATAGGGSGIVGLADRVAALGGQLTVTSPIGHGTTVAARIPLGPSF